MNNENEDKSIFSIDGRQVIDVSSTHTSSGALDNIDLKSFATNYACVDITIKK